MTAPERHATTGAVLLAAGGGSRFRAPTHKLLAPLDGRPLWHSALAAAVEAAIGPVVVVTGGVPLLVPHGVWQIDNARWADGQATSLATAVDFADDAGWSAIVVGLADQPGIDATAWRAIADATAKPIAVATYGGRRRNPVRLARAIWPELPRAGDEGARAVMRLRPELVQEVACSGRPADIDTVEDLAKWSSSTTSP